MMGYMYKIKGKTHKTDMTKWRPKPLTEPAKPKIYVKINACTNQKTK